MAPNLELRLNEELKRLNDTLRTCKLVEETLQTKGWSEVVEPLIDRTIGDLLGSKINGRWNGGILDRARKEERREYYIGYKQALIDLHRRIYAYADNVKTYEDKKDALIAKTAEPKFKKPMLDDTRY